MADGQLTTALLAAAAVLVLLVLAALLIAAVVLALSRRRACPPPGYARAAQTPATTAATSPVASHAPVLQVPFRSVVADQWVRDGRDDRAGDGGHHLQSRRDRGQDGHQGGCQDGRLKSAQRSWHLQARLRVLEGTCAGLGRRAQRGSALIEQGRITFTPRRWALWGQQGQQGRWRQGSRWGRAPLVVPVAVATADGSRRPGLGLAFSVTCGARRLVVPTRTGAVLEVITPAPVSIAAVYTLTQAHPGTGRGSCSTAPPR